MEWPVLPNSRLLLRVQPLFPLWRRPTPTQCPVYFPQTAGHPGCSLPKAFLWNSSDILSILTCSCRLVPGHFIRLLPHNCCVGPRSVTPLLHSEPFQRLFPSFLYHCSLRRATYILWVILLPAAANSFRGPQFPPTPCHYCTTEHLLAGAANFPQVPQSPGVSSCGSPSRPAARWRPLCRFVVAEDFPAASSIRISRCSTSDSMSSGFRSLLSRHASIVIWQDMSFFVPSSSPLSRH
jgi:hypothetical protein